MQNTTTKLALALSLLLPTIACDLDALPDSDRSALTTNESERPHARRPGPPPPFVLLERAVEVGKLQDDAGMIEALTAMETAHDGVVAAGKGLRLALAEAVTEGTVDADAFSQELATITRTATGEGDALTMALDTAHGLLGEELRAEVVDGMPKPPPRPESGKASGEQQPPRGAGSDDRGPQKLVVELALDEAQQQALRDALGEPERPEPPAPLDLEAFANDDFEAASLGLAELHSNHITEHATRHLALVVAIVPLLDDDQRATLEDLLREAPSEPTRSARG